MPKVLRRVVLLAAACLAAAALLSACDPPLETPRPTPAATSTPSPASTLTSTPFPTPTVTPLPTSTPTVTPLPTPTPTVTPAPNREPLPTLLPDLVISLEVRLISNPNIVWGDGCIVSSSSSSHFLVSEFTVHVRNVGGGDAGSFTVRLNNADTITLDGLKAGEDATLVVPGAARSENLAVVDADLSVDESDESNNTSETFIPVPTLVPPAPTCTPESR